MGALTLVLAAVMAAQSAVKQSPSATDRAYVTASGGISHLSSEPRFSSIDPPVGGFTGSIAVSVGAFIDHNNAVEGEISYSMPIAMPDDGYYSRSGRTFKIRHRDLTLNGLLRSRFSRHVELVLGGGVAFGRTVERPMQESESPTSLTLTTGLDAVMPAARRVSLVPSFRLRWIHRTEHTLTWSDGVGNYIVQFGLGIRFM